MKITRLSLISDILIITTVLSFLFFVPEPVFANSIITQANSLRSKLFLIAQAASGIGIAVALILGVLSQGELAWRLGKVGVIATIISFAGPSLISGIQSLGT